MSSPAPYADARALLMAANIVPAAAIEWPNEPFEQPNADPSAPATWLSVQCVGRTLTVADMGADMWTETGTTYVDVIVPANTGSETARGIAKQVANVFRGLQPPRTVIYLAAAIGEGALMPDNGIWWILTVSVDWQYQDVTTS